MYKWLMMPPPAEIAEAVDKNYSNEELNVIMKNYMEQMREKTKAMRARMEATRLAAAKGEAGPVHEDLVDQTTEISFEPTEVKAGEPEAPKEIEV